MFRINSWPIFAASWKREHFILNSKIISYNFTRRTCLLDKIMPSYCFNKNLALSKISIKPLSGRAWAQFSKLCEETKHSRFSNSLIAFDCCCEFVLPHLTHSTWKYSNEKIILFNYRSDSMRFDKWLTYQTIESFLLNSVHTGHPRLSRPKIFDIIEKIEE